MGHLYHGYVSHNQRVNLVAQRQVPNSNIKGVDHLSEADIIGESRCPILPTSQSLAVQSFVSISLGFSERFNRLTVPDSRSFQDVADVRFSHDFPECCHEFSMDFPMISGIFFQDVPLICHGSKSQLLRFQRRSRTYPGRHFPPGVRKAQKKTGFSTGILMGIHGMIWWFLLMVDGWF